MLVYQSINHPLSAATKSLTFFGGQNVIECICHRSLLTVDAKQSTFLCSIALCKKSVWRCPSEPCPTTVCASHFKTLSQQYDEFFIDPPSAPRPLLQSIIVSGTSVESGFQHSPTSPQVSHSCRF